MKEANIEDIAYLIYSAKENNLPKPIVFLGAGASVTGGIPLASAIVKDIERKYPRNPKIRKLSAANKKDYASMMECLLPAERNRLLKEYIDQAKINVTHIYLAHLITQGYIDFVLTVNFDNLMLRALALFNYFPPTYDLAVLKALTTTSLHEKSVVYLHGQHHGLWLLNTKEELKSVDEIVSPVLNKIASGRPWIIIGYSGNDPIFDHIIDLGRFDNGMFWVCYKNQLPGDNICRDLLNKANTNASILKGYDSDTFMLSLNNELGLGEPFILDKPFSFLRTAVDNIVEIYEKKGYASVKERLKITKKHINLAIQQFEEGKILEVKEVEDEIISDQLKREIINKIIQKDFEGLEKFREQVGKSTDEDLKNQLADLYYGAGMALINESEEKEKEETISLLNKGIKQLEISISLNSNSDKTFNDLSFALIILSRHKAPKESETLLNRAIEQCQKSIELKKDNVIAYSNWGVSLTDLAKYKEGEDRKKLLWESIELYKNVIKIKADSNAFHNMGLSYVELAKLSFLKEQEDYYQESIAKFREAINLEPEYTNSYVDLAFVLLELAKNKPNADSEKLIMEAIAYCNKVIKLDAENAYAFSCLGLSYFDLGELKKGEERKECYQKSIVASRKTIRLRKDDSFAYNTLGNALQYMAEMEEGEKARELLKESIQHYKKGISIKPNDSAIHESCSAAYIRLARRETGVAQVNLFFECEKHVLKAKELSGKVYNLSCFYAIRKMKKKALDALTIALKQHEVATKFVLVDKDWEAYYNDPDFKELLDSYS